MLPGGADGLCAQEIVDQLLLGDRDRSWYLILQILVVFIGDFRFGVPVSVPELIVGMIGAVIASLIHQLFVFSVDYSRTEYTQFEDDDYYYYVKAVPKIAISRTDVKVQEINKVKRR